MPTNMLAVDTGFPNLTDAAKTSDEKFLEVESYMRMLVEQLRYSLKNLGTDNFNETELDGLKKIIKDDILVSLSDGSGASTDLSLTVAGLTARMTDAENNISSLLLTAQALRVEITDNKNNISSLTQTAQALQTKVQDAENNISTLTQTANGLQTRVQDAEGSISTLTQTANALQTRVQSAEGSLSTLTQTANGIEARVSANENDIAALRVSGAGITMGVTNGVDSSTLMLYANGVLLQSETIQMSGLVRFTDLSGKGTTTIDGSNIKTGIIEAIEMLGVTVEGSTIRQIYNGGDEFGGEMQFCYGTRDYIAGRIRLDDKGAGTAAENRFRMFLGTYSVQGVDFAMKLHSAGDFSIHAGINNERRAFIYASEINLNGTVLVNGIPLDMMMARNRGTLVMASAATLSLNSAPPMAPYSGEQVNETIRTNTMRGITVGAMTDSVSVT